MRGKFRGVQARFVTDVPGAHYLHCRAHSLNVVIVHTCQQPEVRNMLDLFQKSLFSLKPQ